VYQLTKVRSIAAATYLRCATVSVGRVKRPVFAALQLADSVSVDR
jgi:hypothetical protein